MARVRQGRRPLTERPGAGRDRRERPGQHFLGSPHTLANFETPSIGRRSPTTTSLEQWELEGRRTLAERANAAWKRALAEYEPPPIDEAVDLELREWIERRKASFPDSNV